MKIALRHAPVTVVLLVLIATAFAVQVWAGHGALWHVNLPSTIRLGGRLSFKAIHGQWWRLVMAGLLHGGLLHVAMNAYAMKELGSIVERVFGGGWLLTIFTISVVAGNALSAQMSPANTVGIGASGGLFGLIAMAALASRTNPPISGLLNRSTMNQWLVFGLVLGVFFRFDNWAHLGGAIAGAIAGLPVILAAKRGVLHSKTRKKLSTVGWILGALSSLVIAYCILLAAQYFQTTGQGTGWLGKSRQIPARTQVSSRNDTLTRPGNISTN